MGARYVYLGTRRVRRPTVRKLLKPTARSQICAARVWGVCCIGQAWYFGRISRRLPTPIIEHMELKFIHDQAAENSNPALACGHSFPYCNDRSLLYRPNGARGC